MKTLSYRRIGSLVRHASLVIELLVVLPCLAASAVTFTNDTTIASYDTNYDGLDITVTNCTVTVDGVHSFASLQVLGGGTVTHSTGQDGTIHNGFVVSNELQVLSATNVAVLSNANVVLPSVVVQDLAGQITYSNGVDYTLGSAGGNLTALLLTPTSAIAEGSTNLVSYPYYTTVAAGLSLSVTGGVTVAQGGMIFADGKGYISGLGPGRGNGSGYPMTGSGAGHGGFGGQGGSSPAPMGGTAYDVIQQPVMLGSGGGFGTGGPGANGGGSIKLLVGGVLRVDGSISANGDGATAERAGGGAGGSIWISAQNFAGTGIISADGGAGEPSQGGGGGGGRIALWYDSLPFTGNIAAHGGNGYVVGGAGTIYLRATSQPTGQLLVDNAGRPGANTTLSTGEVVDLTLRGGARVPLLSTLAVGNLVIGSNAWISVASQQLTVISNAMIETGAGITADGAGGSQGLGAGSGAASTQYGYVGGGGGYGGFGAAGGTPPSPPYAFGGTTHGSVTSPTDLGGAGGSYSTSCIGGPGGGAIRLDVGGMLLLDGRISADGAAGVTEGGGGGSGGSVWLTVGTLAGAGAISANGGMGNGVGLGGGGGGGGGRIAVQYGVNLFFGAITALGGTGAGGGGAGTVYSKANSQPWGLVVADNGGQAGTNTTWMSSGTIDLTVKGGAVVVPPSTSPTFGTLVVASNGWLSVSSQIMSVTGNATVQAGGGITADGTGYASGEGPGAGRSSGSLGSYTGGGGGYGGFGAAGSGPTNYPAYGGMTYGSVLIPMQPGSGGGGFYSELGGAGGGVVNLRVMGLLQVDGRISAAGLGGTANSAGGGSGGGINLNVGTLAGSGVISANGGMGSYLSGGGGGGRIAIVCSQSSFSGLISAYGGGGYAVGGAGTIYTAVNQSRGLVLIDNAGQAGTNTTVGTSALGAVDVTVRGGAILGASSPTYWPPVGTLLIASNSWIILTGQGNPGSLTVSGNAIIQAGGGIIADGLGSPAGDGAGAGRTYSSGSVYVGGGGGYGGYGGAGNGLTAYGGMAYGAVSSAAGSGSGGAPGQQSYGAVGGAGGGAVGVTVTGTLQVDGKISARGLAGIGASAGGGSGGGITLTVGTLAGSGVISADGGMGNYFGGGGGGGRISIIYGMNDFTGVMSAYGGRGYTTGGAGTIYTMASSQSRGLILADNGGQTGTNTSVSGVAFSGDLVIRGGAVVSLPLPTQNFNSLLISSNGWLSVGSISQPLTVLSNAIIQPGGGIIADGTGSAAGIGPGAGRSYSSGSGVIGGGAGYGGYGAAGGAAGSYGGSPYGSAIAPQDLGSGGAPAQSSNGVLGGAGGGDIRVQVNGTLQVDGRISARGLPGIGASAGGGSGGAINLSAGILAGSGLISANGGAGNAQGGGGGGGRIAISYTSANAFSGQVTAYGGTGYGTGGAGTVYIRAGSPAYYATGPVVIDNGGQSGTNSGWPSQAGYPVDVTLRNGAWLAMPSTPQTMGNLVIGSNSWIYVSGSAGLNAFPLMVTGNATIQAGGGISADGGGYSYYNGGLGSGGGGYGQNASGGGGFGGSGGAGGNSYAYGGHSVGYPSAGGPGYPGGGSGNYFVGGSGGGGIGLSVSGVLQVDGRISSAGGAGVSPNAGGGSGGGISLTVGTLSGAGSITANGGAGNGVGGGGGGGRISITYNSANAFSGLMTAYGGSGYIAGGAGTIYTKAYSKGWGQVLADNGGQVGATTGWSPTSTFDLTATGGAVIAPPSSSAYYNILVTSNAWITVSNQTLTVISNATIQAGGGIIADAAGYPPRMGPGTGMSVSTPSGYASGGGGHGGYGAAGVAPPGYHANGGVTYDSITAPTQFGDGGASYLVSVTPGSAGGAVVALNVVGSLIVDGRISANGGAASLQGAGGGAGGSVSLSAGTLAGTGVISANGGAGNGLGGGGGGGRIAIQYGANVFQGSISAHGGGGAAWGGAGTIYTKASRQGMGQVLVDNSGNAGADTPLPFLAPYDLTISGGALVHPANTNTFLQLSNLLVGAGGTLTCSPNQFALDVSALRNVTVDPGGLLTVDGKGWATGQGPGAGLSVNGVGSGAGYGGQGAGVAGARGGASYGSAQQPVDPGSGGGLGWQHQGGGGEGGGALRLDVGGVLTVNGAISSAGNDATQDNGGGGSGGSIWVTAGALVGDGTIAADGGAGEPFSGGGGSGGRIAIYSPLNIFSGAVSAAGGTGGLSPSGNGSFYTASSMPGPQVGSSSPAGVINNALSEFDFTFTSVVNPASVSAATVSVTGPGGVAVSNLFFRAITPYTFGVSFAQQTAPGDYVLTVGPQVVDLFGQPMSQAYTGTCSLAWSSIQGAVTDTNGQPVAGVVLQPDGGLASATTDTNGLYLLNVPPSVPMQVTPSAPGLVFVPSSRTYTSVYGALTNENYVAVTAVAPVISMQTQTNGLAFNWYGIAGVTYQPLCSTNLVDWVPYADPMPGSNAPVQFLAPVDTSPMMFFRVGAAY